jgi:hypothetical protein
VPPVSVVLRIFRMTRCCKLRSSRLSPSFRFSRATCVLCLGIFGGGGMSSVDEDSERFGEPGEVGE